MTKKFVTRTAREHHDAALASRALPREGGRVIYEGDAGFRHEGEYASCPADECVAENVAAAAERRAKAARIDAAHAADLAKNGYASTEGNRTINAIIFETPGERLNANDREAGLAPWPRKADAPEAGKVYALTSATGPSIANGNTWAESVVSEPATRDASADDFNIDTGFGGHCEDQDAEHWYDGHGACGHCSAEWVADEPEPFAIDIREGEDYDYVGSENFPNRGLAAVTAHHVERLGSQSRDYKVSWSSGACPPEQIEEFVAVLRAAARQTIARRAAGK